MSQDFPDDVDDTGLAYVTATAADYGYGKLKLYLRLPELNRDYPALRVDLVHSAQFGGVSDHNTSPEPSYGWHLRAFDGSDGLEDRNLERTTKAVKRLKKAMDSSERASGPATLLEQYLSRLIYFSKVKYVYLPDRLDDRRSILEMDMWMPARDGMTSIHDRIKFIKSLVVKAKP